MCTEWCFPPVNKMQYSIIVYKQVSLLYIVHASAECCVHWTGVFIKQNEKSINETQSDN